jgi:hypothetical protein
VAENESPLDNGDAGLWEDEDERVWDDDHVDRLRSHATQLDARAGRLLARVPAVSFGALALNDGDGPAGGDPEWFPGVKLVARNADEYQLLVELRGLLVTAADRAGIGRLLLKPPAGDVVNLFDATEARPQNLSQAVDVLDATPKEATSGWMVPPEEVDGFQLTPAEAAVYGALQEMDLLFTPQCWVLHKGRRLYHLDFVVYHQGRAIAIEVDEKDPQDSSGEGAVRERFLRSRGLGVVRLDAGAVGRDIRGCMKTVVEALDRRP